LCQARRPRDTAPHPIWTFRVRVIMGVACRPEQNAAHAASIILRFDRI